MYSGQIRLGGSSTQKITRGRAIGSSQGSNFELVPFMITKQKGDIAEQAAILRILQLGWGVSKPVGDRLSYDLVADVGGALVRIQVKSAWFNKYDDNYVVDTRRTKTNRRIMVRSRYIKQDFDFALVYVSDKRVFYIFPVEVFMSFGSTISLVESDKRQRKPRSANYREAWKLISSWAAQSVTTE